MSCLSGSSEVSFPIFWAPCGSLGNLCYRRTGIAVGRLQLEPGSWTASEVSAGHVTRRSPHWNGKLFQHAEDPLSILFGRKLHGFRSRPSRPDSCAGEDFRPASSARKVSGRQSNDKRRSAHRCAPGIRMHGASNFRSSRYLSISTLREWIADRKGSARLDSAGRSRPALA